jgi:hypothetical protein
MGERSTIQSARMRTRLVAWLYTGPLGHLAAGVADWLVLLARHVIRRSDQ